MAGILDAFDEQSPKACAGRTGGFALCAIGLGSGFERKAPGAVPAALVCEALVAPDQRMHPLRPSFELFTGAVERYPSALHVRNSWRELERRIHMLIDQCGGHSRFIAQLDDGFRECLYDDERKTF